ncbi:NAD(+) kinase [Pleionea sp. CnH1-48]|uniref:NAD(+) kinase n=1 Tax=Pleionea sp. CnH1-48 TaxID=2954494 RepID=UPI0020972DEA|nr:NAD(+) kinase [Pleionea sp. CnH1-48]MCO7224618.1 NAD(+) kinase [Pleionea sp. CnH1-48]
MPSKSIQFQKVGIMGKPRSQEAAETIKILHDHLVEEGCDIWLQDSLPESLHSKHTQPTSRKEMGKLVDLVVVVGGDGSMLNAGRYLVQHEVPLVGINRGHLGFLTDVRPTEVRERISEVLRGQYNQENRFILHTEVYRNQERIGRSDAVNELVLYPGEIARMLEFELFIDNQFVYSQRSDGLIVSTPTGSTAYALSGGGPIISPKIDAMVLVPMFPHTLSSRPIVIDANSHIEIAISSNNQHYPMVSCDGQVNIGLAPGDIIGIKKHPLPLKILHPESHDYYEVLRTKLGWGQKL